MKYVAKFDVMRIEPDAPKAEELDRAVEDAIRDMDVEGCEVRENSIDVERAELASEKGKLEYMAGFAKEIRRMVKVVKDLDIPWEGNKQYTNRQMLEYWCEKLEGK